MNKICFLFSFMILCCAFVHAQKIVDKVCDYEVLFKEAKTLVKDSAYGQALLVFNSARRCDPSKAEVIDIEIEKVLKAVGLQNITLKKKTKENADLNKKLRDSLIALNIKRLELIQSENQLKLNSDSLKHLNNSLSKNIDQLSFTNDSLKVVRAIIKANDLQIQGVEALKNKDYDEAIPYFNGGISILRNIIKKDSFVLSKILALQTLLKSSIDHHDKQKKLKLISQKIDSSLAQSDFQSAFKLCIEGYMLGFEPDSVKSRLSIIDNRFWDGASHVFLNDPYRFYAILSSLEANAVIENKVKREAVREMLKYESKIDTLLINNQFLKTNIISIKEFPARQNLRMGSISLGFSHNFSSGIGSRNFIELEYDKNKYYYHPDLNLNYAHIQVLSFQIKNMRLGVEVFFPISNYQKNNYKLNTNVDNNAFFSKPELKINLANANNQINSSISTYYRIFDFYRVKNFRPKIMSIDLLLGLSTINGIEGGEFELSIKNRKDNSFYFNDIIKEISSINSLGTRAIKANSFLDLSITPSKFNSNDYDVNFKDNSILSRAFVEYYGGVRLEYKFQKHSFNYLFAEIRGVFSSTSDISGFSFNVKNEYSKNTIENFLAQNGVNNNENLVKKFEEFNNKNNDIIIRLNQGKVVSSNLQIKLGLSFNIGG